eukprot:TRINITY_DN112711_c0_g1_i1.p1 TRINITY_DN112711_c0_g1~~TRINITY_DN112711_c0_g1_i1.p1  ORF type:complete len:170 (+),score=6.62 TRINITY_DN112711_c0_g1_i1:201-710(+)
MCGQQALLDMVFHLLRQHIRSTLRDLLFPERFHAVLPAARMNPTVQQQMLTQGEAARVTVSSDGVEEKGIYFKQDLLSEATNRLQGQIIRLTRSTQYLHHCLVTNKTGTTANEDCCVCMAKAVCVIGCGHPVCVSCWGSLEVVEGDGDGVHVGNESRSCPLCRQVSTLQ